MRGKHNIKIIFSSCLLVWYSLEADSKFRSWDPLDKPTDGRTFLRYIDSDTLVHLRLPSRWIQHDKEFASLTPAISLLCKSSLCAVFFWHYSSKALCPSRNSLSCLQSRHVNSQSTYYWNVRLFDLVFPSIIV